MCVPGGLSLHVFATDRKGHGSISQHESLRCQLHAMFDDACGSARSSSHERSSRRMPRGSLILSPRDSYDEAYQCPDAGTESGSHAHVRSAVATFLGAVRRG